MPTPDRRGLHRRTVRTLLCTCLFLTAATAAFSREPSQTVVSPEVPSAPRPADGAVEQIVTIGLAWECTGAVSYDVYFGTELDPPLVASNVTTLIYPSAMLEFETLYRWRIVARDALGAETSGPVWSFVTRYNSPPIPPFDPTPNNQALVEPDVVLRWRSGDPDQQPVTYRVFFGTTNPPPTVALSITDRFYPLTGLQPNRTYYWRIVASDGEFTSSSIVWRFYVVEVPVLISRFEAVSMGGAVEVTWDFSSDEPIESVELYRRASGESFPVALATVDAYARSFRDETARAGETYDYELVVQTLDGDVYRSPIATVTLHALALALHQNHPNPFNPQTTIAYQIPSGAASQPVRLSVLDVNGRLVRTLVNEGQPGGAHSVTWNGSDDRGTSVASGVYFYVLDVGGEQRTRKLVLLK